MSHVSDERTAGQPNYLSENYRRHLDLFAALAAPFDEGEVKTRTQGGRSFSYVTARTVANRLDDVVGPANWWDAYRVLSDHTVLCELTILLPDGREITKQDAGANATTMPDVGDGEKGGLSDAFKRAAAKYGVARYLYRDGIPHYGDVSNDPPAEHRANGAAPSQARPAYSDSQRQPSGRHVNEGPSRKPYDGPDRAPTSGRSLFAWSMKQKEATGFDVVKHLQGWGTANNLKGKMTTWPDDAIPAAHAEALAELAAIAGNSGDAHEEVH